MSIKTLNNVNSEFKAFGSMIFCGSATIGAMNAGYNVNKILEISDDIVEQNAYHFVKNFPDLPVVLPSEWETDEYLNDMKNEKFNLAYFNCPCSSLSKINRQASVDGKNNIHFYRVYNIIDKTEPETFVIENAPTLIKLGYPILKDLTHQLGNKYRFTIIRDYAGNHNVAMKRLRTLVVGWRKDKFNKIPLLHANIQPMCTLKDCIGDLYDKDLDPTINHVGVEQTQLMKYEELFDLVPSGSTTLKAFIKQWDVVKDKLEDKDVKFVEKNIETLKIKKSIWDKTPYRPFEDGHAPSLTSVAQVIHPVNNRNLTIREYARLMNYPDDFILYEGGKTPIIQCLAQGVPANFIEYIATEVKEALKGNREYLEDSEDKVLNFQNHIQMKYEVFNQQQIDEMTCLEVSKKSLAIKE